MRLILLKIGLYFPYLLWKNIKWVCSIMDWEINPRAGEIYMSLVEPVSFYKCLHIHCQYESTKSIIKSMLFPPTL